MSVEHPPHLRVARRAAGPPAARHPERLARHRRRLATVLRWCGGAAAIVVTGLLTGALLAFVDTRLIG